MKNLLYLSFYFEPDLSAGSFRNTTLVKELASQLKGIANIDVYSTKPNRYSSFNTNAPDLENFPTYNVHRISIPKHRNGMFDQIKSFYTYFKTVRTFTKTKKYDLVVASSSRLFTAYLAYIIAKRNNTPLYLDIRDIFRDTMDDVLKNRIYKAIVMPILKYIENKVFQYATHLNLISGGFREYFEQFNPQSVSYFSNGIDNEFLNLPPSEPNSTTYKTIVYAGNLGEGQGLDKFIPRAAQLLGNDFRFVVIGDGGTKKVLSDELERLNIENVELRNPVKREKLLTEYHKADYLLMHLNDYEAFEKVLPSKIFELAAFDKPILAGVSGYAAKFVRENVPNSLLFKPCHPDEMVSLLKTIEYKTFFRTDFISKFSRNSINYNMARSIRNYLN